MLQKNLQDSDVKSVSTKMTAPTKAASFSASAKRQMFKQVQAKNKLQQKLHNYLSLNPEAISAVSVPQIHMLENGESYVLLNDGHYTYIAGRSKPYMLARNSESHSCLLFSNARMPGSFIFFESLETYKIVNRDMVSKAYIHINITKYNP